MSLSFSDPRFDEVKAPVDECKDKDMTYAAPLFVTAEFINTTHRRDQEPDGVSWVTSR